MNNVIRVLFSNSAEKQTKKGCNLLRLHPLKYPKNTFV